MNDMNEREYAYWLADKIPAYGDYAKEAALVLQRQADEIERLRAENSAKQARIDELMQEYCPDEITHDQWENIEANTRPVDADTEATLREALKNQAEEASRMVSAEPVADDAKRYQWLRSRHWSDKTLVVTHVDNVKLGSDCPTLKRMDEAIDNAMLAAAPKPNQE